MSYLKLTRGSTEKYVREEKSGAAVAIEEKLWKRSPDNAENRASLTPADSEKRSRKVASYDPHNAFCHPERISFSFTAFMSNSPDFTRSSSDRSPSSRVWFSASEHNAFSFMEKDLTYSVRDWSVRMIDIPMSAVKSVNEAVVANRHAPPLATSQLTEVPRLPHRICIRSLMPMLSRLARNETST